MSCCWLLDSVRRSSLFVLNNLTYTSHSRITNRQKQLCKRPGFSILLDENDCLTKLPQAEESTQLTQKIRTGITLFKLVWDSFSNTSRSPYSHLKFTVGDCERQANCQRVSDMAITSYILALAVNTSQVQRQKRLYVLLSLTHQAKSQRAASRCVIPLFRVDRGVWAGLFLLEIGWQICGRSKSSRSVTRLCTP